MKINEKLTKVDDAFTVHMYDNGYMFDISGRNSDDEWASAKIMCSTNEELCELVNEAVGMERS
jgi:hypothetical protein